MEGYLGRSLDITGDFTKISSEIYFGDLTRYHRIFVEIFISYYLDVKGDNRRFMEILVGYLIGDHLDN